jgi:hypothetical protein
LRRFCADGAHRRVPRYWICPPATGAQAVMTFHAAFPAQKKGAVLANCAQAPEQPV